ncbi:hypothetical protein BU23DRAFT_565449 [Bimuria novae-zelandiae CBS 107.79]|uniref:RING-type domain-containing protein n=1 Tax=Bimuria novae-zelandiae CBS 107.79 TaxID=1447943 RepID=A0A6A5VIF1_9PLEO|nr:hypothetical protein BU23DRAFT_565449 [Bimuria novae-zelandiae CBS 107.79]
MARFESRAAFLNFLRGIISFKLSTPQHSDRIDSIECFICREEYRAGVLDSHGETTALMFVDEPVALPCNHIFGLECILNWVLDGEGNTCPSCRDELYTRKEPLVDRQETLDELYYVYLSGWTAIAREGGRVIWRYNKLNNPESMREVAVTNDYFMVDEFVETLLEEFPNIRLAPIPESYYVWELLGRDVEADALEGVNVTRLPDRSDEPAMEQTSVEREGAATLSTIIEQTETDGIDEHRLEVAVEKVTVSRD